MYVYLISFEISSSPSTPGITNEPLLAFTTLCLLAYYLLSCRFEDREFRSSLVVYYPSAIFQSTMHALPSSLNPSTLVALL